MHRLICSLMCVIVVLSYWLLFSSSIPPQCSSHALPGGADQRGADSPGAAGFWGETRTRSGLWGRGPGRAAEEASRTQSPQRPQQVQEAGAAPVRTAYCSLLPSWWTPPPRSHVGGLDPAVSPCLTGWRRTRCANRSWGREWGCLTMRWWRASGGSWLPGRRNAPRPRRRKTRPGRRWRRGRASWNYWTARENVFVCLLFNCWQIPSSFCSCPAVRAGFLCGGFTGL